MSLEQDSDTPGTREEKLTEQAPAPVPVEEPKVAFPHHAPTRCSACTDAPQPCRRALGETVPESSRGEM